MDKGRCALPAAACFYLKACWCVMIFPAGMFARLIPYHGTEPGLDAVIGCSDTLHKSMTHYCQWPHVKTGCLLYRLTSCTQVQKVSSLGPGPTCKITVRQTVSCLRQHLMTTALTKNQSLILTSQTCCHGCMLLQLILLNGRHPVEGL